MFKENAEPKKVTINRILILVAVICSVFAVGIILLSVINNASVNTQIKGSNDMQINYAETESNTWDISEIADGSVIATLSEDGVLTISGTGDMRYWSGLSSVPWYSVREEIKQVNIQEGVTNIERYTFYNCINLTNVTIPEGVTYIAVSAFSYCRNLTDIEIPSSVTNMEEKNSYDTCFLGCSNLKNIKVDENNDKYCDKDGVLFSKDKTKIIRYPEGKKDTTYKIPSETTSMGKKVFQYCDNLTNIEIPSNISEIEYGTFDGCSNLVKITIREGVKNIRSYAFRECSNIKEINIPSSVIGILRDAFEGCSSLTNIKVDGNNTIYSDVNGVLYSKDKTKIIKYPIGKQDTTYTILNGVTSIEDYAFYQCSNIEEIIIPEGIIRIKQFAFGNCSELRKIIIPEGVTSIENRAFCECTGLTEITLPNSMEKIELGAFWECSSLQEIIIPEKITSIAANTFYKCINLRKIAIPEGVTSIGDRSFYECISLTEITIPSTINSIGVGAFDRCKLTNIITIDNNSVELPDILTRTQDENDILYSSKEFTLENCTIEDGKVKIEDGKAYASIKVEDGKLQGLTYIIFYANWDISEVGDGSVIATLSKESILTISGKGNMKNWSSTSAPWHICREHIKQVEIQEGITNIGEYAFAGCNSLTEIEISEGVTSIGNYAFYYCVNLVKITIPEGVMSIGNYAFASCSSLEELVIPASIENIEDNVFNRCSSLTNIKVNENNKTYCDDTGILFTKDKREIVCYPAGKVEETYTISGEVTNIRKGAFVRNKYLTKIIIQEGVTSIGWYAFEYCYNLISIEIPDSVTDIQGDAFADCRNITILCHSGSTAEAYARENEIPYKIIHLSSTQQQIDEIKQIVRKIKPKTTVEQIKTDIQSGISYEILNKEGNVVEDASIIGTGYVIKLSDDQIYILIVMGDINGDGKIGISQGDATEIEKMAIDVNMDGNIKVNDLAAISRMARE